MSYVVAIDVGIKNLGMCVFDFTTARVVAWDNTTLVPSGRYIPANNVQYVRDFVNKWQHYFDGSFQVIIERQMRANMRVVEAVLQTMFFDRCTVISARSVKAHYNLSTKNYRNNKLKAIQWMNEFMSRNPLAFDPQVLQSCWKHKKKDDLADALLLIMYYLDTYSNQLTTSSELPEWLLPDV